MKSIKSSSISNPTELKQLQKLFVRILKEWAIVLLILEKKTPFILFVHLLWMFLKSPSFKRG